MTTRTMHRTIDQLTSIAAAKSILPKLSKLQRAVLNFLRRHQAETGQGMTDLQLEQHELSASRRPSIIRKRRLELQRMGYVADSGHTRGKLTVWIAVNARDVAANHSPPGRAFTAATTPPAQTRNWSTEQAELIAWFQSARDRLPDGPFQLVRGIKVINAAKFSAVLERDIRAGPTSARANGGVQHDLTKLKELFDGEAAGQSNQSNHVPANGDYHVRQVPRV